MNYKADNNSFMYTISILVLCFSIFFIMVNEAKAWEHDYTTTSCPNGYKRPSDFTFYINTVHFPLTEQREAIDDVITRINYVGGQWLDIDVQETYPTYTNTSRILHYGDQPDNVTAYNVNYYNHSNCTISRNYIVVNSNYYADPDWGVPADNGENFWESTGWNSSGDRYYRHKIIHEMLHGIGYGHNFDELSYQNYSQKIWTNREKSKQVELTPDDREGLRAKYGNSESECDVAVSTVWNNYTVNQERLCQPSGGYGYSDSPLDSYCAKYSVTTSVCPGDRIYARYTAMNYSTISVSASTEFWFSTNTWLDTTSGVDKKSPTTRSVSLSANQSIMHSTYFSVPTSVSYNTYYYIMVNTTQSTCSEESESTQNNWIPLRGRIYIKPSSQC